MKIGGVCVFCIKKMWQVIAALLVFTAIIISVLKYTLPHVGNYSDTMQDWVRDKYGAEIYIGKVTAGWDGIGPAMILENISFLPNESAPLDLVIRETRVKLDFWKSIRQRQLTSDYFVLDGVTATVDGASLIQSTGEGPDAPIIEALSQLFLGQLKQFRVEDSTVKLNTRSGDVQTIKIDELTWYNEGLQHQGVGEFRMGTFANDSLSFVLDLHGEADQELNGQLYVEAAKLDVSPWLLQFVSANSAITESNINFSAWATITEGIIEQAQIQLTDNEIQWARDDLSHHLIFGNGQMLWVPTINGWSVRSSNIQIGAIGSEAGKVNFNINKQRQSYDLYVSEWSVERAVNLLTLLEVDPQVSKALDDYQPIGMVHDLHLKVNSVDDWQFTGLFDQFGFNQVGDVPGTANLSGHFGLDGATGWLKVEGVDGQLQSDNLLAAPLAYENLEFKLSFWQDFDQNWQLLLDEVWLHNQDIDFVAEASIQANEDMSDGIDMALYAELSANDLTQAGKYYPPEYMGQEAIDYLNLAMKAGSMELGQLLWNGKLSGFPFEKRDGVFLAQTQVTEVDFFFAPGWPVLSNVDGVLEFRNDALSIYPQKGYLLDLDISEKAVAVIPSLSDAMWLDLDIDSTESMQALAKLFKATPLREIFTPVFEQLQLTSPVKALAKIRIPLVEDEDEFNRLLNYQGKVVVADNQLYLRAIDMDLTEVNGTLLFDVEKIWMDDMTAIWKEQPMSAKLLAKQGYQLNGQYIDDFHLDIDAISQLDVKPLLTQLNDPFAEFLHGQVAATAAIDLYFPDTGVDYTVDVKADVDRLSIDIPAPFAKEALSAEQLAARTNGAEQLIRVNVKGDEDSLLATANYGQKLFFNGIMPLSQPHFSQAHLIIADKDMGLAGDGFKISVDLPEAEVMPWYDFIDAIVSHEIDPEVEPILTVPKLISGKIGKLNGFNHRLNGVDFELTEGNGSWDLALNAKETRTLAHFDRDWEGKGISIRTEYLRLTSNEQEAQDKPMTDSAGFIASIPPIVFSCQDCQYDEYNLARVDVETQTRDNRLLIKKFNITKGKHQWQASGEWTGDTGNGITSLNGRLISDDIGMLLNEYELTSAIRDSDARVDLVAQWTGGPQHFNLATLGGEIKWRMGEGHLTEVSDRGSRLLSLFSFDSIVRKLKLDFRDVFSKGFFYNSMQGSLLVENGIAYTDNTEIDGVPGDLNLQGNVNLMEQKLDYQAVFYPKVTSSLPVIIGWMVNPISGIAALALDKMLESTKVIAQVHFTIGGTIEEPIVTETDRKSRDIEIPKTAQRPTVLPQVGDPLPDVPSAGADIGVKSQVPIGKFVEQPLDSEQSQDQPKDEDTPLADGQPKLKPAGKVQQDQVNDDEEIF